MAQFTFTVPDELVPNILNAYASQFNYQTEVFNPEYVPPAIPNPDYNPNIPVSETNTKTIPNPEYVGAPETIPNPETKQQFLKRIIITQIKRVVERAKTKELRITLKEDMKDWL